MACLLVLLYILTALTKGGWCLSHTKSRSPSQAAIYFLDNQAQNSVVALTVNSDGTLSDGSVTATGGAGGVALHGNSISNVSDALFSSSSVQVFEDLLLAVNAGSNSISIFQIDPNKPTALTQIGLPIDTQGDFPVSIAVSNSLNQACVANSGLRSGITCFDIVRDQGLIPTSPLRFIPLNQTNPPTGVPLQPFISSVSFNSDSSSVIATITGSPSEKFPGYLAIYPVINKTLSSVPLFFTPNGTGRMFSTLNIPHTNSLFITDTTVGTAIINLNIPAVNGSIANVTTEITDIPGQHATCWVSLSPYTNTVFVSDALVNRIVELDLYSGVILGNTNITTNGNEGNLDSVAVGDKVYFLSPGFTDSSTAVVVLDVGAGSGKARVVQNFNPKGLGVDVTAQGMAAYY